MVEPARIAPESIRPLRRVEFDRMAEAGLFEDERVELLHGVLVAMSPPGPPHATTNRLLIKLLVPAVGDHGLVQVQDPLAASEYSQPQPDVAVLAPAADAYLSGHPQTALLVIEVADSSLAKDRDVKADLYAAAGVPEYWIVDLRAGQVEVYTEPEDGCYRRVTRHGRDDTLRLLALPDVALRVRDFLPVLPAE